MCHTRRTGSVAFAGEVFEKPRGLRNEPRPPPNTLVPGLETRALTLLLLIRNGIDLLIETIALPPPAIEVLPWHCRLPVIMLLNTWFAGACDRLPQRVVVVVVQIPSNSVAEDSGCGRVYSRPRGHRRLSYQCVRDRKLEPLTPLAGGLDWSGVTPDGSPLIRTDHAIMEVYALILLG